MRAQGFTLVELTITIALLAMVAFIGIGVGASTFGKNQIAAEASQLINTLRLAQSYSIAGNQDDVWGIHVTSGTYTLFKGNDYATRDTNYDQVSTLPGGLTLSGLSDVIFDIRTGATLNTGTITVTHTGSGDTVVISINATGRITDL